ncbi:hypothetical protein ABMA28_015311 [Loxostege sticticalis]|uniref:Vestigial n=1 Tax=Loxostege sticticalis TaxID=481309 RepID=A0ABD0T9C5_LOXSC
MAVSCPEVMYGAYYPYLYGRGAARSFHHAPHFQYDRFNVQSGAGNAGSEAYGGAGGAGGAGAGGAAALSSGSASSGAQSPGSPPHAHHPHHAPRLRAKEEDLSAHGRASADGGGSSESEGECGGAGAGAGRARAQYVSANCVVFTHYSGDVAAVVDEHFARALSLDKPKESVPMVSRNLPASFFNAAAAAGVAAGGGACAGVDLYDYDPWHQHYTGYGHAAHRHAAEYHAAAAATAHHNMAAAGYGVGGLLLGRSPLHHQYKPVDWPAQHPSHHLDPAACSPYYPPVPGPQTQDPISRLSFFLSAFKLSTVINAVSFNVYPIAISNAIEFSLS